MSAAPFSRLSELFREGRRLDPAAQRDWLDDLEGGDVEQPGCRTPGVLRRGPPPR